MNWTYWRQRTIGGWWAQEIAATLPTHGRFWLGVADYDVSRNRVLVLPLGVNVVVAVSLIIWRFTRYGVGRLATKARRQPPQEGR